MTKLAGKVALVCGDFGGFGAGDGAVGVESNDWALVSECAREGAAVMVADARADVAEAIAAALRAQGGQAHAIACDVGVEADCAAAVAATQARVGRLDLLVNTVGHADMQDLDGLSAADFAAVLHIHVVGAFQLMKHAIPAMRSAGGGAVVTISSLSAIRTGGAGIGYETAKAALLGLTRNVALSEAANNIRVNSVLPGALDSAAFRQLAGPDTTPFAARIPMGRLGTPREFAKAIVFLLSDEAAFITGAGLVIDGGMGGQV
jgi:NAD(P)-dependent dehydrogenase (short-subunit alcohol dehydrogenase family)